MWVLNPAPSLQLDPPPFPSKQHKCGCLEVVIRSPHVIHVTSHNFPAERIKSKFMVWKVSTFPQRLHVCHRKQAAASGKPEMMRGGRREGPMTQGWGAHWESPIVCFCFSFYLPVRHWKLWDFPLIKRHYTDWRARKKIPFVLSRSCCVSWETGNSRGLEQLISALKTKWFTAVCTKWWSISKQSFLMRPLRCSSFFFFLHCIKLVLLGKCWPCVFWGLGLV